MSMLYEVSVLGQVTGIILVIYQSFEHIEYLFILLVGLYVKSYANNKLVRFHL